MVWLTVFVDAPNVLLPADIPGTDISSPADTQESSSLTEAEAAALTPRAWWRTNPERTRSVGLEASLLVLRDILHGGARFDVCVLCFHLVVADRFLILLRRYEGCVWIQVRFNLTLFFLLEVDDDNVVLGVSQGAAMAALLAALVLNAPLPCLFYGARI